MPEVPEMAATVAPEDILEMSKVPVPVREMPPVFAKLAETVGARVPMFTVTFPAPEIAPE